MHAEFDKYPLIGLIGPAGVGKDTTAERLGRTVAKFAKPLYSMANHLSSGYLPDDVPAFSKHMVGGRQFLQQLGAWGRGEISEKYPWTLERALAVKKLQCDFRGFGTSSVYWIDMLLCRLKHNMAIPGTRIAVTDVRYLNEVQSLWEIGCKVFVVACRYETLFARQTAMGYSSASLQDTSEQYSTLLFNQVLCGSSFDPAFGVIWADTPKTCPPGAIAVP
jgi:hypothetical protein